MERWFRGLAGGVILLTCSMASAADSEVLRVAGWMLGSFDSRAQAEADRASGSASPHQVAVMTVRPIEDPVDFGDAPYLYVESRIEGEAQPYKQRVYRVRKTGKKIRLEVFTIDGQFLAPLALDPRMLSSLNPGDLRKEEGCDLVLDASGEAYAGGTAPRSCKADRKGSAYVASSLRVSRDGMVLLDREFDEKDVQTFGPADGRGYEFRRTSR